MFFSPLSVIFRRLRSVSEKKNDEEQEEAEEAEEEEEEEEEGELKQTTF